MVPPPQPPGMTPVLERNIRSLQERRERERRESPLADRIADAVTAFAGSMTFVVVHMVVFGFWALVNSGLLPVLPRWDETFVILGTSASVEAIFLSTFVLISQNRMAAVTAKRADLDLQISLLAEHEITKLVTMTKTISDHLGLQSEADAEVSELELDVAPEAVLDEMEARERDAGTASA